MPNTREKEKLIELLKSSCDVWVADSSAKLLADHLIANGVTFATDNNVGDKMSPAELLTNCKQCANSDTIDCSDGMVWCKRMCRYMKEDGFCSFGERKTDEG